MQVSEYLQSLFQTDIYTPVHLSCNTTVPKCLYAQLIPENNSTKQSNFYHIYLLRVSHYIMAIVDNKVS